MGKRYFLIFVLVLIFTNVFNAEERKNTLEEIFLNPAQEHKPLIIWQWMDGLVTKEGITHDLEAFKEAGLAGVQNFQIGGPMQMRIGNPDNAIGSDNWKSLLKWTLDECQRLGLTFGTHNCPGWSSSAYVSVSPEFSMQKLVYSEVSSKNAYGKRTIHLEKPEVDPQWNYYEDVAVMAVPQDSIAAPGEIIDLSKHFDRKHGILTLTKGLSIPSDYAILRIGQTTNGKSNFAQAPESGRGLECDKLSREAVKKFWDGYPSMVLDVAGNHVGKTFTYFEIDSYEAGGQTWSTVLPEEFKIRKGYDIIPYLPFMAGRIHTIVDKETTRRFLSDWEDVVKQCVAENYYGYMTELAREAGVKMLIEPYGTGGQSPFRIIDFEKIVLASEGADIATEFWQDPISWGWRDMGRHEASMRKLGKPLLIAEAFTCWPLRAWSDNPATIKPMCDKAFCTGVNRMMLHAGAANPWPDVEPGMSFGIWGTHFVPGQTWWKAGGAKAFFEYMARCQALLQQGFPAPEQLPKGDKFLTYRRADGDTDIIFVCNPSDSIAFEPIQFETGDRSVEIWEPYNLDMYSADQSNPLLIEIEPFGSRFIIVRNAKSEKPGYSEAKQISSYELPAGWEIEFPKSVTVTTDSLFSWADSDRDDIRYFSGTATYRKIINIPDDVLPKSSSGRVILSLGEVKDMASVSINGKELPLMWKYPYEGDITDVLRPGENLLEVSVTNLWRNRMIGDEYEPDDLEWSEPLVYDFAPGKPRAGQFLTNEPEWLKKGLERPSKGRQTVGCFKFFTKDSPLLPSGMLGPVKIIRLSKD